MEGSISILLGCLFASRTVSFCFSFGHVARYAPSQKTKTYGTIAKNSSQANYRTYLKIKCANITEKITAAMLALLDNERGLLSTPLIGYFVEAGIDIVHGIALSFGAGNDEAHLGYLLVGSRLAADANKGQRNQPTAGDGLATVTGLEYATGKGGCECATCIDNGHHVGKCGVVKGGVSAGDGVGGYIKLSETGEQCGTLAILQLITDTSAHNLHIDARAREENILVLRNVSRAIVCVKFAFAQHLDIAWNGKENFARIGVSHLGAVLEEGLHLLAFALAAVGISFVIFAGREGERGHQYQGQQAGTGENGGTELLHGILNDFYCYDRFI